MKVVFVTSHPIQYQVPIFRLLESAPGIEFLVLFAMLPDATAQGAGFDVAFDWDIPLMDGYEYRLLENISPNPSVTTFRGCDTPGIYKELKSFRPDAVVVNGWVVKTCMQALWACKRLRIPCVVRGEANDLRPRPWWKRMGQGFLVRQYDACLYIGSANRAFYRSRGVTDERLFPAPYCVENERFSMSAEELKAQRQSIRSRWSIPEENICYLFCGKFEPKKHPLELLRAFRLATKSNRQLHLLMVGDGKLRKALEQFATDHELPVTFTGFLNQGEIIEAYVAADCLVLPSDAGETWGLVVNEAMACGRPALVSDRVGCAEDLVEKDVTGDVFSLGDTAQLAGMLADYGADPARLKAWGAAAQKCVQDYSPEAAAAGIQQAVGWLLQRARV